MRVPREFIAILPVSAVALLADAGMLHGLVRYAHWHYLAAATAGFGVGVFVNYLLSVRYVFGFRRLSSARREFAAFALIGVGGLGVNAAVIAICVDGLGLHYMVGKGLAAIVTFLFNFGLRRQLLFMPAEEPST